MSRNLVSVILPCYKMGRFIGEALASIGQQTHQEWEVIAVDDCGPEDGTREAVGEFAALHSGRRIEWIRQDQNCGVSAARNRGFRESRGAFLAFLDPDDHWRSDFLTKHLEKMLAGPQLAMSFTDSTHVSPSGQPLGTRLGPRTDDELRVRPCGLFRRNFINPSASLIRRSILEEVGLFDESGPLQHVEDWDLWLRMVVHGAEFAYTPEAVCYYRRHPEAATADMGAMRERVLWLRMKHADHLEFRREQFRLLNELELENESFRSEATIPWVDFLRLTFRRRGSQGLKRIYGRFHQGPTASGSAP